MSTRRRHSLNPDNLKISPLVTGSNGDSPISILTRNRRSFVFSSTGGASSTGIHMPHSATNIQSHVHGSSIVAIDSKMY